MSRIVAPPTLAFDLRLERGPFRLSAQAELPLAGVTAIVGTSGSGKTTLLRCLAGLEMACRGEVSIGESVWQSDARRVRVPTHRRALGYVFQDSALLPHLTVRGNLEYARARCPDRRRAASTQEVAALTRVDSLLSRRPAELSGGERQRVALARTLLSSPTLLLLDEPLASLDDAARGELLELLERVVRQTAAPVLYVTHAQREVARLADRVLPVVAGRVQPALPVQTYLSRLDLPHASEHVVLSMLEAEAIQYDPHYRLATLRFDGGELRVPAVRPPRRSERLLVRSSDVGLCLAIAERTSVVNTLPVIIEAFRHIGDGMTLVRCRAGQTPLVAAITTYSFDQLALRVGASCFAQLKATSLMRPSVGADESGGQHDF